MKKLLPILVFLFAAESGYAQNWNPLDPGSRNFFVNNYGYLKGMRIDSMIVHGSDLHYFPFRTLRSFSDGYFGVLETDTAGSWLGKVVIRKVDGMFLFPNYWDDTIKIKTLAAVGDSWLFYHDSSTIYYNAEVTGIDTMTVLGTIDSVKRILLTAYDGVNPLLSDSFNNAEIILSKNHGFFATMELYLFPYHAPDTNVLFDDYYFINSIKQVNLAGMGPVPAANGQYGGIFRLVDYVNPTMAQLNDWNVGDVQEYGQCWISTGNTSGCDSPMYSIDTIISKVVTGTGIEYVRKFGVFYTDTLFYPNDVYLYDTVLMPEEFDATNWGGINLLYYYFPNDTQYCYSGHLYYDYRYMTGLGFNQAYHINKIGTGLLHSNYYQYMTGGEVTDQTLQYFVRNGVPCGTYVPPDTTTIPVSVVGLGGNAPVNVYPNPAFEQVTVETSLSDYGLAFVNTIGQIVHAKQHCSEKETIDVRALVNGIYHLRIETADGAYVNRKVVVQH